MLKYLLNRVGTLIITMATLSVILFAMMELNLPKLAREMTTLRASDSDVEIWLQDEGFRRPIIVRYTEWVSGFVIGEMGKSYKKDRKVSKIMGEKLVNTAYLMGLTMLIMVSFGLVLGIIAGMKEGSWFDKFISIFSITTTSVPDYVSGVVFMIVFGVVLQWLPPISKTLYGNIGIEHMILPALSLSLYGLGYIARMTRASMVEVMTAQYIRTAILKGMPYKRVILKHALRNALIAPFTVIVLQIPWLLTGVVAIELLFSYEGFGKLLLDAATTNDIPLVMACAMVTVFVVVSTQILSDVGYMYLNPRIRKS